MSPFVTRYRRVVGAAFLFACVSVFAFTEHDATVPPTSKPVMPQGKQTASAEPESKAPIDLTILRKRHAKREIVDVFAEPAPVLPPAPKIKPIIVEQLIQPPSPPPTAPPLPFRYLGRLLTDGRVKIFLSKGDVDYSVVQSDLIESIYKVEEITDTSVSLRYLPLDILQTLDLATN